MAIDLLNLEPTKVSRDLSGYIIYLYGRPKVGKSTFAKDAGSLILAAEAGYNAMAGAYKQDIVKWSDLKAVVRELKKPAVKEKFKSVAVDTVDQVASLCEKYVCNNLDISSLGDADYGKGWSAFKKEFESVFREITMLGYGVIFISHEKIEEVTKLDGTKYNKIVPSPTNSARKIIAGMSDIIAYAYTDPMTAERKMKLRSNDDTVEVGSRFKYMVNEIPLGYDEMVKELNAAIDRQEQSEGKDSVTDERITYEKDTSLNYAQLMQSGNALAQDILAVDSEHGMEKITEIVERILGVGRKFGQCTSSQVEAMSVIIGEFTDLLDSYKTAKE